MMQTISFTERVKNTAIREAQNYKKNYVDYEYLVCSDCFVVNNYYIISARKDNYQHLIGINSLVSAQVFFEKCYDGTLLETDFNFKKSGQSEKDVKGTVRRKITVLGDMMTLLHKDFTVQETFVKNNVTCTFATTDGKCTVGFVNADKSRPRSLIKGDELDSSKKSSVSLLLRKKSNEEKFEEILIGDKEKVFIHYEHIKNHIADSLICEDIEAEIAATIIE